MRILWFIPLLICACSGCQKIDDTERPVASIDNPNNGAFIQTDDGISLRATLSDNTGLLQFKFVLNGIDSLNGISSDSTYATTYIDALPEETSHILEQQIELPDSTFNGYYYAVLSCLDIEGNESLRDTVSFQIINSIDSEPPVFDVSGPVANDTLGIGQGFVTLGTVSDSRSLVYSDIYIGRSDFSDTIQYTTFPWIDNNLIDYTNNYSWWNQVDSTWSQGQYVVYYTAWDNYSGISHTIPFHVKY